MPRTAAARKPTADQAATIEQLQKQLADQVAENNRLRSVPPVVRSATIDTGDFQIGNGDGDVMMPTTGAPTLVHPSIDTVEGPAHKEKVDALAFNEEKLVVYVPESTNPKDGPTISIWVNGRHQLFIRGQNVTCARKFVERLARARPVTYSNVEFVDGEGNRAFKYPKRTSQRYPFSVVSDPNPNGKAWLRKILAEA